MQMAEPLHIKRSAHPRDSHVSVIEIVAWFMTIVMILMVVLRMFAKIRTKRQVGLDDALAVTAMCTSIGSTVAISVAIIAGLGSPDVQMDESSTTRMLKALYSSSLLYLVTIWLAKLSTLVLMVKLFSNWRFLYLIWTAIAVVLAWGISAILADAFKCGMPVPWNIPGTRCINTNAYWNSVGAVDIATDMFLVILPFWLFADLHMKFSSKAMVILAFACRIVVVVAAAVRLAYLNLSAENARIMYTGIGYHVCTQIQQSLSVMVASVPAVRVFMERAPSVKLSVSSPMALEKIPNVIGRHATILHTEQSRHPEVTLQAQTHEQSLRGSIETSTTLTTVGDDFGAYVDREAQEFSNDQHMLAIPLEGLGLDDREYGTH